MLIKYLYLKPWFVGPSGFIGQIHLTATNLLQFLLTLTRDQLCINPGMESYRICQGWSYTPLGSPHVAGASKKNTCSLQCIILLHYLLPQSRTQHCDGFPGRPCIESEKESITLLSHHPECSHLLLS